jgi:putative Holliday junction resolvase
MAIAALDLGKRRIGIATADDGGLAVHPIGALERRSVARDLELILARLVEFEVTRIVVGLPLNMDGSVGPAARAAMAFAHRLREASGLQVDLFDERLTSFEAEERLKKLPGKHAREKGAVDAVAASVILESWLNHRRSSA